MMQILIHRARTNYYRPILFAGKGLMEAVETCKEKYERLLAEYEKKIADIQNGQDVEEIKKHRYDLSIADIDFSVRTNNCLRRAGLNTLGKIEDYLREHNYSWSCLAVIRNLGKKSCEELIERLAEYGIKVQR
jgi:DNA-directed RNA polymerase subunit alpha